MRNVLLLGNNLTEHTAAHMHVSTNHLSLPMVTMHCPHIPVHA